MLPPGVDISMSEYYLMCEYGKYYGMSLYGKYILYTYGKKDITTVKVCLLNISKTFDRSIFIYRNTHM